jgi:outer membrane protein assembly factor BamB
MKQARLWPAYLVLATGGLWLLRVWLVGDAIRQARVISTIATVVLVAIGLLLWLAFLSRLPRRTRLVGSAAALAALALLPAFFRIRGVSGDLLPIVEPRFAREAALPEPPPTAPEPPQVDSPASAPSRAEDGASAGSPVEASPAPGPASSAAGNDARPRGRADASPAPASPPPSAAAGASFPQFLGPARDGTLAGPRLARDWAARPPKPLWRQPIGAGWAGFAVSGETAVTQEQRGAEERVTAYAVRTGRPLWSHADTARYETVIAGVGPRATPTIAGGRVYAMGATGILNALELATGRRLWSRDVLKETGAALPDWGRSCSPLVVGRRVVVIAGGPSGQRLVAYDAETGAPAWSAGEGGASYSSPTLVTLSGREQLVVLNAASVSGHDPASGAVLWEHPFPSAQPNVAMPAVLGPDRLLVSAGYGVGSKAYRLTEAAGALEAKLEWESPRLKSKFANLVVHGGFVYGLDDGVLTCLDPANGERRWKSGRHGHGQLLLVAGLLLVQTEEGELVLVEPSPDAYRELARFPALEGKTWNPPALAGSLLLVRNDREAAAYELPTE